MLQHPTRSAPGGFAVQRRTPSTRPAPAVTAAFLVGVVVLATGQIAAVAFAPAVIAAYHDVATRRLPDRWVAATAVCAVVATIVARGAGAAGLAVGTALVGGGALLVFHLVSPRAVGFGDVKFAAALGPVLVAGTTVGTTSGVAALVALWLCAASAGAIVHAGVARRSTVPFGPALVLGAALVLVWGGIVR